MARVRLVPRSDITDEFVIDRWDKIFGDGDPVSDDSGVGPNQTRGDYWAAVANSPETVKYVWDGFAYLASQKLARPYRELGMTRAGFLVGSKFVYSQHSKGLRAAGWSEEKIKAVPHWQSAACYDEVERLLFAVTDTLVLQHGRMSDELFESLRQHLSDQEIVEFIHATLIYAANATVCRALRVEYDDVPERVEEVGQGTYGLGGQR
jgi:alkylhydroperoxidase family enzyme